MTSSPETASTRAAITHPNSAIENDALNAVRVLAALAVVLSHVRTVLLVDYDDAPHDVVQQVLYGLSALGKQAVVVFFVLSGFWVGGTVLRRMAQQHFRWADFSIDRTVRLSLVLVPALLLTAALDAIGRAAFASSSVYTGSSLYAGVVAAQAPNDSWSLALGNAFFLVGVALPSFGTNAALWSVGYEFWMYAAGALIIFALVNRGRVLIGAVGLGVLGALVLDPDLVLYVGTWLLGAAVAALTPWLRRLAVALPRLVVPARVLAAAATVGAALVVRGVNVLPLWLATLLVALPTAALISSLATVRPRAVRRGPLGFASKLAASSYSLYAIHVPIALLLIAALGVQDDRRWPPDPLHWVLVVVVVGGLVAVGWGFSLCTEQRTAPVRAALKRTLHLA